MANDLIFRSRFTGQQMDDFDALTEQLVGAIAEIEDALAAKYVKPASGIPEADLDAAVQSALAKARTAVQDISDYYTKTEIDALLAAVNSQQYVDVTALPTASADTLGKIYLVGPDANNQYARYYTSYDGSAYSWVAAGTTEVNLTNYVQRSEFDRLDQEVNGKQAMSISLSQATTSGTGISPTPAKDLSVALKAGEKYKITWTGYNTLVKKLTFYTRDDSDVAVSSYWDGGETASGSFSAQKASFDVIPTATVYKMRLYAAGTDVIGTGTIDVTIENYPAEGLVDKQLKGWILDEAFTLTSATRDADDNVTAADVVWPDGENGTLTITRDSDGAVTQVVATHGSKSYILTITRDSSGNVTSSNLS